MVTKIYFDERREFSTANIFRPFTSLCKRATGREVRYVRRQAGDLIELFALFVCRVWNAFQQTPGIRICGPREQRFRRGGLKHLSGVHNYHSVRHTCDNAKVVGYENNACPITRSKLPYQVKYLC